MSILVGNPVFLGAGASAGAAYKVERSLRFNSSDSAYLSRTPASAGNRKTWTWAGWVKGVVTSENPHLFTCTTGATDATYFRLWFVSDSIRVSNYNNNLRQTAAVYRDPSAWYHIVLAVDTTQATAANRIKLYVNGSEVTAFSSSVNPNQNDDFGINQAAAHSIGATSAGTATLSGYLADVHFIDGQALTPSSFTEVSATTGQLIPKAYTGSYGTNGFHLPFSDNSTAAALGTDTSGNGNTWTVNNISVTQGSVAEATGALPLYNTTDTYGFVKGTGFRSDSNASALQIAVAGGSSDEVAYAIRGSGSALALTNTGVTFNQAGKFYSDAYLIQNAGSACEVQEFSDAKPRTNDFCVEFWINPTTTPGNSGLFSYGDHGTTGSFAIITTGSGSIRVDMNGTIGSLTVSGGLVANQWQHFALTRSGTTCKLYRNGVSQGSWAIPAGTDFLPSSNPRYVIGNRLGLAFSSYNITSYFQDFRVYVGTQKYSGNFNIVSNTVGAGNDSLVDTPTSYGTDTGAGGEVRGNYATWGATYAGAAGLSNGNLDFLAPTTMNAFGSISVTSGKWYWEILNSGTGLSYVGIMDSTITSATDTSWSTQSRAYVSGGSKYNGSSSSYGSSWAAGDVIGFALDLDSNSLTFYKNGVSQGVAFSTGLIGKEWKPFVYGSSGSGCSANFGQRQWAYAAPAGFKALCDTNLPAPVVAKSSDYFQTVLYTGNGSTQTISGLGFSPDFVWIKERSSTSSHQLYDTIRGATKTLYSNSSNEEQTNANALTSFTSTGFNVGVDNNVNQDTQTYVAWTWDAGSSTAPNTSGSISSQVRVNTSAGFSIVTYTGTGANATVGHGLGAAPQLVIVKRRDVGADWTVYHISGGNGNALFLNSTASLDAAPSYWNSTSPTSTTFSIGTNGGVNISTGTYVAYCFAPVTGYSSFGSYTGNGSSDGPFVYTGFRPRWVMVKSSSLALDWCIFDAARDGYNAENDSLYPNSSQVENNFVLANEFDILSNGFKPRANRDRINQSSATYIWAAFAEHPFQYARAR